MIDFDLYPEFAVLGDDELTPVPKAVHTPPNCPRCDRQLAPEHCELEACNRTVVNTVTTGFGQSTSREVVPGTRCTYHCWWCGDASKKLILEY